jgi:hypothetical protein
MLADSRFTSSIANPILLQERCWQIRTLLMVIAGHPCTAEERFYCWDEAKTLYLLMQKYQLDRLQPWVSKFAGRLAGHAPWEALCLACNNPCFDEDLARYAIFYGIQERTAEELFDPEYFVASQVDKSEDKQKRYLLHTSNTKSKLSIDLGLKGYFAFCKTFSDLAANDAENDWQRVAARFIATIREFEEERKISVRTLSPPHSLSNCILRLRLFVLAVLLDQARASVPPAA